MKSKKRKKEFEEIVRLSTSTPLRKFTIRNQNRTVTFSKCLMLTELMRFFYKGYKTERYYWELLIFLKKVFLTFIAVIT